MPIVMTQNVPGMPGEMYDQIISALADPLSHASGFVSHAAVAGADGVTVTEIWESKDQWAAWFDASVRPHLPPGVPEPTIAEVRNAIAKA